MCGLSVSLAWSAYLHELTMAGEANDNKRGQQEMSDVEFERFSTFIDC